MGLITVIDASGDFAGVVGQLSAAHAGAEVRPAPSIAAVVFDDSAPFVVVIAPSVAPSAGFEVARAADVAGVHTSVVIVANEINNELMRSAMRPSGELRSSCLP